MIKNLLIFLFLILIPGFAEGATTHTMDIEFSFAAPDDPAKKLLGYRLYKEGIQVCQTSNADVSKITCELVTEDGTFNFTLTALYSDGTESPHSPSFLFTIAPPSQAPLQAIISTKPATGIAPLNVTFDGTDSPGDIVSYIWDFGDGIRDTGLVASHIYSTPGSYTASLRVVDQAGAIQQTNTIITVQPNTSPVYQPIVKISSSTPTGTVPLQVTFDVMATTVPSTSIVSYIWTFGDGSQAAGKTAAHTFMTEGIYDVTLVAKDSAGQTARSSIKVVASASSSAQNYPPVPLFTMSQDMGVPPFKVSFAASGLNDLQSSLAEYSWNFGDNTTASGLFSQHTYSKTGIYTVTLTVKDNSGATASSSKIISVVTDDELRKERARGAALVIFNFLTFKKED